MVRTLSENKIIELEGVGKAFKDRWVFRNVDLSVGVGQCIGLLGGSGSGKSTLIRGMLGFTKFNEGSIEVFGSNALGLENWTETRQRLGYVAQGLNLWPYRTVLENVMEGLVYARGFSKSHARERAEHWLNKLTVFNHRFKYPTELSGGEQQRVAIARALALEPQALLCDEPTSGVDPVASGEISDLLIGLRNEGFAMLIASHQIDFLRRTCDVGYFLQGGGVRESGPASEILTHPRTPELTSFIEHVRRGW
jgi:polar amino acid transport system ATP-binding protein